ncbi:MAG TPA: TIGR01212 family radical SAM protein [Candidatus Faeciplasma pullistercoris]|uniref:TIGR01212 family radical SAM protein n=1 Tax=Candidatus Faeciplasma pullistercoris TaxID=2840800 RepID=A0A9D1GUC1_9FIRM|nr:TIGR01212 family radical SAM protein [Candidatus Faeciplasma pullistercoris]
MNPFGEKRFLSIDAVFKREFGRKTVKIPLNAGLGCPNRDGSRGVGGCVYCSSSLSGEFAGSPSLTLADQFEATKRLYLNKWGETAYIAYLQAGSNTYAPVGRLKRIYDEALAIPGVCGLSVATRADCISEEVAGLLSEISERTYLTVELGLQSSSDRTARLINRCHSYQEFLEGYRRLSSRGIKTCVHIINGLPGETKEDMIKTAMDVAQLSPYEIKIHLMHIIAGTEAEKMYRRGEIIPLEREEYIGVVCDQLELLPPTVAIGRLTGDGDKRTLVAPLWSRDKRSVLNGIDRELRLRDSFQGIKWQQL